MERTGLPESTDVLGAGDVISILMLFSWVVVAVPAVPLAAEEGPAAVVLVAPAAGAVGVRTPP